MYVCMFVEGDRSPSKKRNILLKKFYTLEFVQSHTFMGNQSKWKKKVEFAIQKCQSKKTLLYENQTQ